MFPDHLLRAGNVPRFPKVGAIMSLFIAEEVESQSQLLTAILLWGWNGNSSLSTPEATLNWYATLPKGQGGPNKMNPGEYEECHDCAQELPEAEGLVSTESFLCGTHRAGTGRETMVCLPSLAFTLVSVGCSTNFSSGDLDLCMVGRAGSLKSRVSLPPATEKKKADLLRHQPNWVTLLPCDYLAVGVRNPLSLEVIQRGDGQLLLLYVRVEP